MQKGDPFCALQVTRTRAHGASTQTREALETDFIRGSTPLSNVGLTVQPVSGGPFAFLQPRLQNDELGRLANFRVLQLVGQGGMGIVFRAADTRLNRIVALKIMQPRIASDSIMRQRFLREARAMAAIKNEHVVTVYEVSVSNNLPFLAMEFLEGNTLEDYQKAVGRLPLPLTVRIGRESAQGLAAAHAHGLIHRDIKPSNLWMEAPTGHVKILDFGLARADTDTVQLSQVGELLGTSAFMAPEQACGDAVDYHADLFSLGCVLYWLCTNKLPFVGTDILSTLRALAIHDPQPPKEISDDVPAALSELIMQLLQKDPGHRPASSQAVADVLATIGRNLGFASGLTPIDLKL
ncbi:MAG: serine/threonine protein kinase [Gemmataceae bacterium]|nr:serine/threonine protein kinase [Gemmataceae bacterium]